MATSKTELRMGTCNWIERKKNPTGLDHNSGLEQHIYKRKEKENLCVGLILKAGNISFDLHSILTSLGGIIRPSCNTC